MFSKSNSAADRRSDPRCARTDDSQRASCRLSGKGPAEHAWTHGRFLKRFRGDPGRVGAAAEPPLWKTVGDGTKLPSKGVKDILAAIFAQYSKQFIRNLSSASY